MSERLTCRHGPHELFGAKRSDLDAVVAHAKVNV